MATYYIDSDNGNNGNDGLSTGAAWATLDQFTENTRSPGDKAILRRGRTARYDDGTDLLFTSDGGEAEPIIVEADYDNAWSDRVDLSGTATATLTFGSKTITFSADVSSVLAAGDWISVSGENTREFAYEVATVVTTTVTLYLPYKGNEAGSGKTVYNMKAAPIWNTAAGNFQWNFDSDDRWKVQGIHIRGTNGNGNVEIDGCLGHEFVDCIFEGDGTGDYGIQFTDDVALCSIKKCRFYNHTYNIRNGADVWPRVFVDDSLLDGNSVTSSAGVGSIGSGNFLDIQLINCELKNHASSDLDFTGFLSKYSLKNCLLSSSTEFGNTNIQYGSMIQSQDHDGVLGDNRFHYKGPGSDLDKVLYQSDQSIVRSGGSNNSIKVIPSTDTNNIWDFTRIKIFELPIYATTSSKTYTVYFRPSATTDWTDDPTSSELWIELEAWGHASNNHRKITKSTGTIDMNGSTAWQSLTVTVAPAQAGVAYLRCWYAKPQESGKSNVFYVDPVPVIT